MWVLECGTKFTGLCNVSKKTFGHRYKCLVCVCLELLSSRYRSPPLLPVPDGMGAVETTPETAGLYLYTTQ